MCNELLAWMAALALVTLVRAPISINQADGAQPKVGGRSPSVELPGLGTSTHRVAAMGPPAVVFFMCGCDVCRTAAASWARVQPSFEPETQSGSKTGARLPATIVVYSGSAAEAQQFLRASTLVRKRTTILVDANGTVAQAFHVSACPRVFVIDASGTVLYRSTREIIGQRDVPAEITAAVGAVLRGLRDPATDDVKGIK